MSIKETLIKIKGLWNADDFRKDRILTIIMIFLVGTASFGMGRLSALESNKEPVKVEMENSSESEALASEGTASVSQGIPTVLGADSGLRKAGFVVASKNGTKYHFPWCSGAKRILEENKIYFESIEAAKAEGLTPAGNCKGLK